MGILKSLLNKTFNRESLKINDELKYNNEFIIDYLNINFDEKLKNVKILFPSNSNKIVINGEKMYFDSSHIKEAGWSSDRLYRKIYTRNFAFWITPRDYDDILRIIKDREVNYQREKQEDKIRVKNTYSEEFEYDEIDEDIYKCCIVNKNNSDLGNINCGGSIKDFQKIEECISSICKENRGRYYKTPSQNTKFVIIFACNSRTASNVEYYRNKGYKVTSFESALKHFNLLELWDTNEMKNEILRIKETISSM